MNAIVTTTINPPTIALHHFANFARDNGWILYIVGDQKTPHNDHYKFAFERKEYVRYLNPALQEQISLELSELIGWNCIQRRNFGFIQALRDGAEIIATVDDDNIPNDHWGKNVYVNQKLNVRQYQTDQIVFDPLATQQPTRHLWHRGFPIQLLEKRKTEKFIRKDIDVLVQADLWNGDPDIDAIARIAIHPRVQFSSGMAPFCGNVMGPFNSQNTFLSAKVFPDYFLFPGIGRMDDIWASYMTQAIFPNSVIYGPATVKQERNEHDLVKDLKAEMIGYEHNLDLVKSLNDSSKNFIEYYRNLFPERSLRSWEAYRRIING